MGVNRFERVLGIVAGLITVGQAAFSFFGLASGSEVSFFDEIFANSLPTKLLAVLVIGAVSGSAFGTLVRLTTESDLAVRLVVSFVLASVGAWFSFSIAHVLFSPNDFGGVNGGGHLAILAGMFVVVFFGILICVGAGVVGVRVIYESKKDAFPTPEGLAIIFPFVVFTMVSMWTGLAEL